MPKSSEGLRQSLTQEVYCRLYVKKPGPESPYGLLHSAFQAEVFLVSSWSQYYIVSQAEMQHFWKLLLIAICIYTYMFIRTYVYVTI